MKMTVLNFSKELQDEAIFKKIYFFTFKFAIADGQKSLPLDNAVAFWELLLAERYKDLDKWILFLKVSNLTDCCLM